MMSLLLKLPNEVADQIYGCLVGYQFVELMQNMSDDFSPSSYIIRRPQSIGRRQFNAATYEAVKVPYLNSSDIAATQIQEVVYDETTTESPIWELAPEEKLNGYGMRPIPVIFEKLHISILQTCRQIYDRASTILFATNVFSIEDFGGLSWFLNIIPRTRISCIQHLHVKMIRLSQSALS